MLIYWASSWLRPQRQRNRSCRLCPLAHCFPGGRAAAAQGTRIMLINFTENYFLLTH